MWFVFWLKDVFKKIFKIVLYLLNVDGWKLGEGFRGGNKI